MEGFYEPENSTRGEDIESMFRKKELAELNGRSVAVFIHYLNVMHKANI
jgi:hypothetical protein